jgi:uncharacterized membrane protein
MPAPPRSRRTTNSSLISAAAIVVAATIALAIHLDAMLREPVLAIDLIGQGLWRTLVAALGGTTSSPGQPLSAQVSSLTLGLCAAGLSLVAWLAGAVWISRRRAVPYRSALCDWGRWGWLWWLLPVLWELLGAAADFSRSDALRALWQRALPICHTMLWAGWLTTFIILVRQPIAQNELAKAAPRIPGLIWAGMVAYFICFAAMNWMLYESLLTPHGDSAMYEEHVWNLLHGKGFRSYLDNGRLFLGEHVQVIHLFVIPLYIFWPSHILLELCQSASLALGAIPVFRIAHRHSASTTAASLLALAYLLYFPMQFLDVAVTFKTFRPNSFEVPFLLFALDALERGRYQTLCAWLGMALLCQEDAATVIAPLGVWIALRQARCAGKADAGARRRTAWFGWGLAVFGVIYVALVIKVVLPWFRNGADVHFAQYFSDLGGSTGEIVANCFAHPGRLAEKFLNVDSAMFALKLLAPLGFLPLLSPGRLAVGAPLLAVLCLSPITNSPEHHFHAALIPILFWAAAAGMANSSSLFTSLVSWWRRRNRSTARGDEEPQRIPPEQFIPSNRWLSVEGTNPLAHAPASMPHPRVNSSVVVAAAMWGALSALMAGFFNIDALSPLGTGFWDPYSRAYWRSLYIPGERAKRFPAVLAVVPPESRVASTDYIHPRFTHHARSYDYSEYRPIVPADTDFIVIDTQHPYSQIKRPDEVKEYRDAPDEWELLDDQSEGYFIVLRRRRGS